VLSRYIGSFELLVGTTVEKRTYVITGAGSGIGRAIAQKIAMDGGRCVLFGRTLRSLEETLSSLRGGGHQAIVMDLLSMQSIAKAVEELHGDSVDGIIANAGIGGLTVEEGRDRWDEIIATNLTGTYRTVQAFLHHLLRSGAEYKQIVITSSILARLGVPGYAAYCASKAGVLGLMRSLAVELAPKKVLVNAICPGWVETDIAAAGIAGMAAGTGISKEEARALAMREVPLGKMSSPEEIAHLVAYLLNQRSITGQALDINNGAFMAS